MVLFEEADGIGIITLNRPEARNAQNEEFLRQLDAAWKAAACSEDTRVIVLRANGQHFSSGHDLREVPEKYVDPPKGDVEAGYRWELANYLETSRRWRDVPKPSIAQVQGACIAGGLMLVWPCDLIVAADDAFFSDPVVRLGIGGVEYHGHTWELGARKAKEMLFTGRRITATEAERLGMVNHVVPVAQLDSATKALAAEIAAMDRFGLAQAKRAVNQTLDVMGQYAAMQAVFDIHWTGHGDAYTRTGTHLVAGLQDVRAAGSQA
ncbi:MAG: enoyl-CoA hydratase [Pseudonocardia sp. SCN 72-86]|nr:MAG: enoyl-CoA hydratase [Pseudonocardia sp. SCN 72-86]